MEIITNSPDTSVEKSLDNVINTDSDPIEITSDVKIEDPIRINNYIYLGSHLHVEKNTPHFQSLGINVVINCASEISYTVSNPLVVHHYPIHHDNLITFFEFMDNIVEKLHKYVSHKKKVYLHCNSGNSRAPAILIYYFMCKRYFSYDKAYDAIEKKHPDISVFQEFEDALRSIGEI